MGDRITFRVFGTPKPQGSKTRLAHGGMIESAGEPLKVWREDVKLAALAELARAEHFSPRGPVEVTVVFSLKRPASHFGTGRNFGVLKPNAPLFHMQRPDIDKLLRSTLDALTSAGAVTDDCVIAHVQATKTWCDVEELPGAYISVVDIEREKAIA